MLASNLDLSLSAIGGTRAKKLERSDPHALLIGSERGSHLPGRCQRYPSDGISHILIRLNKVVHKSVFVVSLDTTGQSRNCAAALQLCRPHCPIGQLPNLSAVLPWALEVQNVAGASTWTWVREFAAAHCMSQTFVGRTARDHNGL